MPPKRSATPRAPAGNPQPVAPAGTKHQITTEEEIRLLLEHTRRLERIISTRDTSSAQTEGDEMEKAYQEIDRKCDKILDKPMEKFNPEKPVEFIMAAKQMIRARRVAWILEDTQIEGITDEMRASLDSAIVTAMTNALPTEAGAALPTNIREMTAAHLIQEIEDTFVDKTEAKQQELRRAVTKIKMRRNRSVKEYINKHRILRRDMLYAGCAEIINEKREMTTVNHIINGLCGNEA